MIDRAADLQQDFDAVCANEAFDDYREFERALGRVARALVAGWTPVVPEAPARAVQRAGYLLTVLANRGATARAPACPVIDAEHVPFFHADPVPECCHDAVARRWSLVRGLNQSRLAQLLDAPHAA